MKKKILIVTATITLLLALALSVAVSASGVREYLMTYLPGTADTVTNMPQNDGGVGGEAYSVGSEIPQREGYEFLGWELNYGLALKVTYVVNPDPVFRCPADFILPSDPKLYACNEMVRVVDQLTTTVTYAYNENDERVSGTWSFVSWDKADFPITEDTTVTGGWMFTADKPKTYKYTIHYWLWVSNDSRKKVHADDKGEVYALDSYVHVTAYPITDLNKPYSLRTNLDRYRIKSGYSEFDVQISHDDMEIDVYYEEIPPRG